MMATRQRAPVRPELLRWARESAGVTVEEAAPRIGVTPLRLLEAEQGGAQLTLIQARRAADFYERPFAVLFLPTPPPEDSADVQFRRLHDAPPLPWAPAMRALGRQVPALQEEADALFEALEEEPRWPAAAELFRPTADLVTLGEAIRELVGVSLVDQKTAAKTDPQGFRAFRIWREAIEGLGILVRTARCHLKTCAVSRYRTLACPRLLSTRTRTRARDYSRCCTNSHTHWLPNRASNAATSSRV